MADIDEPVLGYCVECGKKHDVFAWPHEQSFSSLNSSRDHVLELARTAGFEVIEADGGSVVVNDKDAPPGAIFRFADALTHKLLLGYARLYDSSDLEMRDGDLARDIAAHFLPPSPDTFNDGQSGWDKL